MRDILIIIPAYNEEDNIGRVLRDIKDLESEFDIIVVNDGSRDQTEAVARREGAEVVSLPYNLGYGAALQAGFKYAVVKGYQYVIQFDADGQHTASDIETLEKELRKGDVEIVIGSRFNGNGTLKTGFLKRISISLFCFLIRLFTGVRITDPTSGLKGLAKPVFTFYSKMGRYPGDYPDADILIHTIRCRFRVREVPASMAERYSGKGMHSGFGLKQVYYMIKIILSICIVLIREKVSQEERGHHG